MEILIVTEPITSEVLSSLAKAWHGVMVKGVADIERGVIALGGEWHMDANTVLMSNGSSQENVWGFNLYPDKQGDEAIEYTSLINIRPLQENRSMEISSEETRVKVRALAAKFVPFLSL